MTHSNPQLTVYRAVVARGYTKGYTLLQFIVRQPVKLLEELWEAMKMCFINSPDATRDLALFYGLDDAAVAAKAHFDIPAGWKNVGIDNMKKFKGELVDMQVVLFAAAEGISQMIGEPFDICSAAVEKATADITRGVRDATP